jgi:hypothetical protein
LESYFRKAPLGDLAFIKRDHDLVPLQNDARYQALIAREEARLAAAGAEQANKAG